MIVSVDKYIFFRRVSIFPFKIVLEILTLLQVNVSCGDIGPSSIQCLDLCEFF